jgi:ATPase family associated with various cellular activities (AAA)
MELTSFNASDSNARARKLQEQLDKDLNGVLQVDIRELHRSGRKIESVVNFKSDEHELFKISDWSSLRKVKNVNDQLASKISSIKLSHSFRPLVKASSAHIDAVTSLAEKYKNFSEFFLDFVAPQIHLQVLKGDPLKLQNFCLVGPPGIGKSAVLNELSGALGIGGKIFDASAIQASHVLNGLSRNYSSADVGLIFRAMLLENDATTLSLRPANSLFCIDEVEKVGRSDQHGSILDLMLTLLERQTSTRFTDVCLPELPLNLEHLNWCFTANSTKELSAPLRSRVVEIEIPSPTQEQAIEIACSIFDQEIKQLHGCVPHPPDVEYEELLKLSQHSPRQQKQLLQLAIARAVRDGRSAIQIPGKARKSSQRMGFL